jgi:hypothetical protein
VASLRMLLTGLVLLPMLVPGLRLAAHFQCWVLGLQCTSMANATFIMSITPVFCAVVER